jgi:hypothetical protein
MTECVDSPPTRVRTLACWEDGHFSDDEYELAPTPCKKVIEDGVSCFIPRHLMTEFPNELPYGFNSYLGIPIFGSHRKVLGHLVFKDKREMDESMLLDSVYRIFTARAGGEMERSHEQQILLDIAQGLPTLSGADRLSGLVRNFAQFMGAREAFITECLDWPVTRVKALVYWNAGQVMTNVEYDIAGNPCEEVFGKGERLHYPKAVGVRWPLELPLGRESYLGIPCHDLEGRIIGHLACFDDTAMNDEVPDEGALKLFGECASAELRRLGAGARLYS